MKWLKNALNSRDVHWCIVAVFTLALLCFAYWPQPAPTPADYAYAVSAAAEMDALANQYDASVAARASEIGQ